MQKNIKSLAAIIGSFILVSLLVYFTQSFILFFSLYTIPVLLAALTYEIPGVLAAGLASGIAIILWLRQFGAGEDIFNIFAGAILGGFVFIAIAIALALMSAKLRKERVSLEHLSMTDKLTGLHNYGYFMERLAEEKDRADRFGSKLSLIMLDIDYFKPFNDRFGHQKGNLLLERLAKILLKNVRSIDIVARYGGEEFAVLLPNTSGEAVEIAERIRRAVEATKFEGGPEEALVAETISAGVAIYPTDASNELELIDKADRALYYAKERGRNRVCVYAPELDELWEKLKR